ncbi:MAG: DUF2382 domain-containing protein [Sphingobium sp.]|nr:DUF2382 domain-containing protein [Sphingobium sp.]
MSNDVTLPVISEEARVAKRRRDIERVSVRTLPEEAQVILRDEVLREQIEVVRVPTEREVAQAPAIRTEGDMTIIAVVEERLVVEKRLFVVEELHVRRHASQEPVELSATLRRTRVEIEREDLRAEGET